jgi:hypothetical protein
MSNIALSIRSLTASQEESPTTRFSIRQISTINRFYSNDLRALLPVHGIPGLAFIQFPNLPRFNPIDFLTFQGLFSKIFKPFEVSFHEFPAMQAYENKLLRQNKDENGEPRVLGL